MPDDSLNQPLLDALRSDPATWLPCSHGRYVDHVLWSDTLGCWKTAFLNLGALVSHCPSTPLLVGMKMDAARAEGVTLAPTRIPLEHASMLAIGERAYLDVRARMLAGELGWRLHQGMAVILLPSGYYNTSFSGETAVGYTRFDAMGAASQEERMLTAATLGTVDKSSRRLSRMEHETLVALVAQSESSAEDVFAALEAGKVQLLGGGPTSEDVWSLGCENGQFIQRFAYEERTRDREEVRALVAGRRYHSFRKIG